MQLLTLDSILRKVLSIGNKEQNQHYPPSVFTQHVNIATNVVLNELCKNYPKTQDYIDLLLPFIDKATLPVMDGVVKIPLEYRRLLNIGVYVVDDNGTLKPSNEKGICDAEFDGDPTVESAGKKKADELKKKCKTNEVDILSVGEWNNRTSHSYKMPKLDHPIACQFEDGSIKICPFDVSTVEVRFVKNPKEYVYGYAELPDGTYQFNANTSIESEWNTTATEAIVNSVVTLYSVYLRDMELENGIVQIKQSLF